MMSLAIYSEVERMIARGEQIKRNPRKKGNFGITGTKKAAPDPPKEQHQKQLLPAQKAEAKEPPKKQGFLA